MKYYKKIIYSKNLYCYKLFNKLYNYKIQILNNLIYLLHYLHINIFYIFLTFFLFSQI